MYVLDKNVLVKKWIEYTKYTHCFLVRVSHKDVSIGSSRFARTRVRTFRQGISVECFKKSPIDLLSKYV